VRISRHRRSQHDIELGLFPLNLREEAIKVAKVRHVSLYASHISSDLPDRRSQFCIPAPGDKDVCAFVHKLLRGRKADAAIGAGHNRDFSIKLTHVSLLSFRLFAIACYRSFAPTVTVMIRFVSLSAADLLASTIPGLSSPEHLSDMLRKSSDVRNVHSTGTQPATQIVV
jgi:hypothetical protein